VPDVPGSKRLEALDDIVRRFDLNEHPFYRDWRDGRLPIERLAQYADEWAPFIGVIDRGWDRIGFPEYAVEEREHDLLWGRFRAALGASGEMRRPQSRTLLAVGENAFASVPEALGALYSFEVQQPATASSKLAGLRQNYAGAVDAEGQQYFVEHAVETDEPAMLASLIDRLSDGDFARARTACAIFSAAAWGALDGVYYAD
jgi:pyrroloquinoline quinone (PQQ) biosynthesis protein C